MNNCDRILVISFPSLPLILISGCLWHCATLTTVAQIVPDSSLGTESSVVTPDVSVKDAIADYLEGGATRDNNLFHSFAEFNIPEAARVYFASPTGIDNILTRVTGGNLSQIFGTLGVDGGANLFLLNPNGIIFGQNSQLDIAGSFLATTADSYIFSNGFNFNAIDSEVPPLLTVNIPTGLQFGSNPGSIINRSRNVATSPEIVNPANIITAQGEEVPNPPSNIIPEGLKVAQGQTLSLIGGEIRLEGGYLNTSEGKIELGGIGANNRIKLNADGNNWQVDYQGVSNFADIKINQRGGIDGGSTGGTQIALRGRNISMGYDLDTLAELDYQIEDFFNLEASPNLDQLAPDRTKIEAQNQNHQTPVLIDINATDTFSLIDPGRNSSVVEPGRNSNNIIAHSSGTGDAGIINIIADSIIVYGASFDSWTLPGASGNPGEINLTAQNMSFNNAGAGVNTFSQADGGIINVDIAQDIQLKSGGFGATAREQGSGGTVHIKAQNLDIKNGGIGTSTFGNGDAGIIDLDIGGNLTVTSGGFGSDAYADGNGGKIYIDARNIELYEAGMGVKTIGEGVGGEIKINAETILLKDGLISAESGENFDGRDFVNENFSTPTGERNAGDGGRISIEAQSLFIDNGNITTSTFGQGDAGNIELEVNSLLAVGGDLVTGINSSTKGAGKGGNIIVTGDRLELNNNASIAADSQSIGQAGDIRINTGELLQLENGGLISVNGGTAGFPGDIEIQSQDINLNQGGGISATTTQGIQGNIQLTGDNLFLRDRSEIVTNATQDATGGNIFLNLANNLLVLDDSQIAASADQGQGGNIAIDTRGLFVSADSKITASSKFGVDGLIQIDTFTENPDSGLIEFSTDPIDPSRYLTQGCSSNSESKFVNIGKGGLSENPLSSIAQDTLLPDLSAFLPPTTSTSFKSEALLSVKPIIEAQAWKINQSGKVELVATSQSNKSNYNLEINGCLD